MIPIEKHGEVLNHSKEDWILYNLLKKEKQKDNENIIQLFTLYTGDNKSLLDPFRYAGWEVKIANKPINVNNRLSNKEIYGFIEYSECPYEIGFKKQEYLSTYKYMSIEDALDSSLSFWVNQNYDGLFNNGITIDSIFVSNGLYSLSGCLYAHKGDIGKEFFEFVKEDSLIQWMNLEYDKKSFAFIDNSWYKVFIAQSKYDKFRFLVKNDDYLEKIENKIKWMWFWISSVLLAVIEITLLKKAKKLI